ncbi:MAG: DUF1015 family protein [Alphaproteobacteria bacterium]|nr:DUF1015 family protein [Alphaproteobacteria bacterium]
MPELVRPFAALRPVPEQADAVAAPPYDVLNTEEARTRAEGKPHSFLHISKPEIDLPPGTDVYAQEVYNKGAENLRRLVDSGVLMREDKPCYYAYRLTMGDHTQTGVAMAASASAYDANDIRKHEFTRPKKEDDRVNQITALNAQTGPVLLAYKSSAAVKAVLDTVTASAATYDVTADDGVGHAIWVINDDAQIAALTEAFNAMPALYIADGHHRSAAGSRVAKTKPDVENAQYFLTVAYADDEMNILDYNRVIKDLNGLTATDLLAKIGERFDVTRTDGEAKPAKPTQFGMYLDGAWYQLDLHADYVPQDDPVGRLDVSLLHANLIEPLLGIADPRTDERIDFVGGIRGLGELEKRVNSGEMAVGFALFATSMADLMAVADAGEVMPPKSTWFEPKLADGLLSHVLD